MEYIIIGFVVIILIGMFKKKIFDKKVSDIEIDMMARLYAETLLKLGEKEGMKEEYEALLKLKGKGGDAEVDKGGNF
jgi:hypothetical protein